MSAGGLWACRRRRGNRTSREAGACSCCFQTSAVNEKEASTLLPKPRPVLGPPGPAVAWSGFTVARRTCPESPFRTTFRSPLTWQREENSLAVRGSSCWTHKWRDRGVSSLGRAQRSRPGSALVCVGFPAPGRGGWRRGRGRSAVWLALHATELSSPVLVASVAVTW